MLLLDPYSTQLDWHTLTHVAASRKVDLWVLFPLSDIVRMTPRDAARARPEWKKTLDRLLGTSDWEGALYKPVARTLTADLFGDSDPEAAERLNIGELEAWVTGRFQSIFPYVAPPVPLKNRGRTLFLFYFTVANDKEAACGLAKRAVTHIITKNIGSISS